MLTESRTGIGAKLIVTVHELTGISSPERTACRELVPSFELIFSRKTGDITLCPLE